LIFTSESNEIRKKKKRERDLLFHGDNNNNLEWQPNKDFRVCVCFANVDTLFFSFLGMKIVAKERPGVETI
jgi:hypothetical protein